MIATNESNEASAEVPFFLADVNNPIDGLTGHVWVLGEVQVKLPGSISWTNIATNKIVEIGHGWYAARLSAAQTTTAGEVKWKVVDSAMTPTFQPVRGCETISELGGEIPVNGTGYLTFYLPDATNPIYADPIEGFPDGTVEIRLPDGVFVAGDPDLVVEFGDGLYGYPLDASDTVLAGKAFIYATATGAQPYSEYRTILGVGIAEEVPVTPPTPVPVPTPDLVPTSIYRDLISGAVNRLCEYTRSGDFDPGVFVDNVGVTGEEVLDEVIIGGTALDPVIEPYLYSFTYTNRDLVTSAINRLCEYTKSGNFNLEDDITLEGLDFPLDGGLS